MEKPFMNYSYLDKMLPLKVTGMVGIQGKAPGYGVPEIEKWRFCSSWGWGENSHDKTMGAG